MAQTRVIVPQQYCQDVTDHKTHNWVGRTSGYRTRKCPGRYTPSKYQAPQVSPAVPSDPFFGLDDEQE